MIKRVINVLIFVFCLISETPLNGQSIELDSYLGEENSKMVEAQMGIYDNESMNIYLNKLGNKLVSHLKEPLFEYQFHLVPDIAPNAFALPGGYIYVTTGLIPLLENEDELACILAHEIIHSNNRHSVRQLKKKILPSLLEIPGELLGVINRDLGELFNAPIKTSNSLLFASYSRKYETEADNEGIVLAASAGYNPYRLTEILSRMSSAIEEATGYKEEESYFADHPYTPDRNNNIKKHAAQIKVNYTKPVSSDFLHEFDGVLFGIDPSKGVIRGNEFLHPDLNFYVNFPTRWNIENQPSNIGAFSADGKAAVFFSLERQGLSPKDAGMEFVDKIDDKYRSYLTDNKNVEISGRKGYLVSFSEKSKKDNMYAYVLWLPLDDKVFKIIGIAPLEYKKELEASAASLRNLTSSEKESIKQYVVKIEKARENETISSLSKRTTNKLNDNLTAIINEKTIDEVLKKGELIKVVYEKGYLGK
ncbi:MAG: M48 family metalloprotease [Bacteroidota bacterium]